MEPKRKNREPVRQKRRSHANNPKSANGAKAREVNLERRSRAIPRNAVQRRSRRERLNQKARRGPGGRLPPKPKALVAVPASPGCSLAVLKSATSVQFVPFQSSVFAVGLLPS